MDILGRKEGVGDSGSTFVSDITSWTLLGPCVDHFYKTWAKHGAPAVLMSDVYQHDRVSISRVVAKGCQTWESPGVTRYFAVSEAVVSLALKLWEKATSSVSARGWRVFDGDVDIRTACGKSKGAVYGLADKDDDMHA